MPGAERARRLAATALPVLAIVVFGGLVGAAVLAAATAGTLGYDFAAYDLAVRRLLDGGALYDPAFEVSGGFGLFYYPPTFVLAVLPFALLPAAVASWAWTALLVAATLAAIAALPVSRRLKWLLVLLAGLDWPLVFAVKLGQVGPLLLLGFALGWRWLERPGRLGAVAAVGTAIKLQPALVLGWALLTGRRRVVVAGFVVLASLGAAATLVAGPGVWAEQAVLLGRLSEPVLTPHSLTPGRLAYEAGLSESAATLVQWLNWAALAVACLGAIARASPVASYLVIVVASQLASPILWDHYALILLLPVAWLLDRGRAWAVAVPLVTAVPLAGLTPAVVYPTIFWLTLLAVLRAGLTEGPRPGSLPAQGLPALGAILRR